MQSERCVWLNGFDRASLNSAWFQKIVGGSPLCALSWAPAAFTGALVRADDYTDEIRRLTRHGRTADQIQRALIVQDVQRAADRIRPVYQQAKGWNGLVSVEVSPDLSYDSDGIVDEVLALWGEISRPNVMIQVHATREVLPAIRQLTADGVNLNLSSIPSVFRYRDMAAAYRAGLLDRKAKGFALQHVTCFACFHSALLDKILGIPVQAPAGEAEAPSFAGSRTQLAAALAVRIHQAHQDVFGQSQFGSLEAMGARVMRSLWVEDAGLKSIPAVVECRALASVATMGSKLKPADAELQRASLPEDSETILSALRQASGKWMEALDRAEEEIIKEAVLSYEQVANVLEELDASSSH